MLVADIKYKLTDDGLGRNADYYQLLAYCTALGLDAGVLVYSAEAGVTGINARVVYRGPALRVQPLDLSGDRSQVERALAELADRVGAMRVRQSLA